MSEITARLTAALADRYAIKWELGSGGMALVYLAEDLKHKRKVAVKVLRPQLAATLGSERFLREIRITAQLQHPHILRLIDSGEADGFLYYVMLYVERQSLRDKLAKEGELPITDAVCILRDVVDALAYAHKLGVVHRDIKPDNVMLADDRHAMVMNFGVAKAVSEATGRQQPTTASVALGTPAYMAPEQAVADPHIDHRADIYAVGALGYEMLTGRPPFLGANPQAVMAAHVKETPVPVTSRRSTVPPTLAQLIAKCLEKSPADRWQTAEELLPQLEALATPSVGMTPTDTGPGEATPRPAHRAWLRPALLGIALVVVVAGVFVVGSWIRPTPGEPEHPRTAIAVLPFQNLSPEGPHAYFAGGLHDELLTQLAKVAALKVISRTSVMEYATRTKPLREIAGELDVGSIVEGSVQIVGDRLRVHVQLIDAATDEHLWAERYDRTLDDAFAIQSDVAQQVVAAVGATLGRSEQQSLAEAPTANAEAYRLYLQGREYYRRPGYEQQHFESAQQLYERALALDSTFALAHAALSQVHGFMSWFRYDPSPERLVRQREEAEAALRLAPDLPQGHIAMGLVHSFGRRDWQAALEEYGLALQGLPNDAGLWERIGFVNRRLGNWEEVDAAFEKATQRDPRDADLFFDLGGTTYQLTGRYADAIAAYNRALTLAPDLHAAAVDKGLVYLDWKGELDTLRAVLEQLPPDAALGGDLGTARAQRVLLLLWEPNPDSLLAVLGSARDAVFEGQQFFQPTSLYAAWAHELRGDDVAAQAAFDAARLLLDSVLAALPDDWRVHAARGLAVAGLGRRQEALREARWLEQSVVYREDAYDSRFVAEERARVLAQAGEVDAALDEIEQLLAGPGFLSVHRLRLDPRWDPIRDNSRFQALLARYEN